MPENGESTKFTFNASALNPTIMATAEVGDGSGRTIANNSRKLPIRSCSVYYFTKWVEAKPLANIRAPTIQKFFWQNIICRFGVPRELTVDNGKQFD
jgi:hypothetical protein